MGAMKENQPEQEGTEKKQEVPLPELLEQVRPPELAKEIKAAVKKALSTEVDGYPKISRE